MRYCAKGNQMARKQFFCIVDTETTIDDTVADIGAVICDKQGRVFHTLGILVAGHYAEKSLFYNASLPGLWSAKGLAVREENYRRLLDAGQRSIATVSGINKWLAQAIATYPGIAVTGYNLAFDLDKCKNTGIDIEQFPDSFCLWQLSVGHFAKTKAYRQFILDNHLFNNPTDLRNMTFKTNAETVASFLAGYLLPPEPHTALEDARDYELPILTRIMQRKNWREKAVPYDWRGHQVKDYYQAKKPR